MVNTGWEWGPRTTLLDTRVHDSDPCTLFSMTNEEIGQLPSDQVSRFSPIQVLLREQSWRLVAGPLGMVPRVVCFMMEEGLPEPRLLTASMYTSYSVPHLSREMENEELSWISQ